MPPKVIAIIGASRNRRKFGNRAVRAYLDQGYTVIPINPHELEIEGLKAYTSVLDVPGPIDLASFYVPPDVGEQVIEQVVAKGIHGSLAESGRGQRRAGREGAGARRPADRRVQHRGARTEPVRAVSRGRGRPVVLIDTPHGGSYTAEHAHAPLTSAWRTPIFFAKNVHAKSEAPRAGAQCRRVFQLR